jgi:hypothetical protein
VLIVNQTCLANLLVESRKFWPKLIYTQIGQALLYQALSSWNSGVKNPCSSELYMLYDPWCY